MSSTTTTTLQPIPYVSFDGKCKEAMAFYETVFGAKVTSMTTGAQMPAEYQMPGYEDKVVNAQLQLPGGGLLYAGDAPPHIQYDGIRGVGLALNFSNVEEAEATFNKLADGGQVTMPFAPTFWAEKFGMLTDKFGVDWLINGALIIQ